MKKSLRNYPRGSTFSVKALFLTGIMLFGLSAMLLAQKTYVYTGTVTDQQGETMPGVSIAIKGTTEGTMTDISGAFSLSTTKATEVLVFSFIGKTKKEVQASAGVPVKVVLEDENVGLEGVVVIGYGTQKKSVVTGAISSVKAKDLENVQVPRIEQAMQGRTSGVTVTSSSGQPGSGSTVRIRGTTTTGNSDPLFVVDGVPIGGGIDYLNSSDIESIEVLKDAASAAIYGTRAASGVILVTTKKGKAGNILVNYNAYFGTQSPSHKLSMLSASDYALLQNESAKNANQPLPFANPESYGAGTDWQSTIFNNNAGIQNHELSISGGNDKSTFYSSFGYFNQEGVVASSISNYNRITVRLNSATNLKSWLKFGNNFGYSHIKSKGSLNTNSEYGGPLSSAVNLDPITPTIITDPAVLADTNGYYHNFSELVVRDADGNPYGISKDVQQEMSNPLAYIQTRQGNFGWSDNFVGDAYVEIMPIQGLKFKSDLGAKLAYWGDENFTPTYFLNPSSLVSKNSYSKSNNSGFTMNFENTLSYNLVYGKHNLTALVGTSAFIDNSKGTGLTYFDLPVNTFDEASMNFPITQDKVTAYGWESADHKVSSMFGRLIYNYDEKYLFTGILRRDGSSRFGSNNKFGIFPSASLGWVVTREGFWPENEVVNFLKIRGSYGTVGNDNIGDFRYLSTISGGRNYTFGQDDYIIGFSPSALSNPDLKWEQTSQANVGFEATLLTNFTLVFDLYKKKTSGMLADIVIPSYVGAAGNPIGNLCSMENKGVELELGFHKQFGDLGFRVSANGSYLKNEVTDLGTVEYTESNSFQSSQYQLSRTAVGHPINSFYGFQILGVFQNQAEINAYKILGSNGLSQKIQPNAKPGDFKYADLNEDGKITADDRTFIGDPTPTWAYGFTLNLDFKGFDLMVFGQGVSGNDVYNALRRLDIQKANWTSDAMGRWTGEGTSNTFPRLTNSDGNKNFSNPSNFFLTSGAYFRVKTLQVGYNFSADLIQSIGIQQLRLYLSSNNLFTRTKYSGFDPEIGGGSYGIDRGVYPQARSFSAGVNVTF
jgi:TonB-dependent starch-binding outer membrane protein SusC